MPSATTVPPTPTGIVLVRLDEAVAAVPASCPACGESLVITGELRGTVLRCHCDGWNTDLTASDDNIGDPGFSRLPVMLVDDEVFVWIDPTGRSD